jgi:tetratricopeptide (TPR) repeat protein
MLPPAEKRLGHLLAAQYLEQAGEREGIVLADHFERAGESERAVPWLRVAANQAMEADDLKAALERVERGARLGAQGDDLAELRLIEAEARYWTGGYVEAERTAREARKCQAPELALRAMSALINVLGPQAKYEEIGQLAVDLEDRPAQPELLNAWLNCKYDAAAFLASAGQFELRERILALLEAERDELDPILVGRIESMKAHVARDDGRLADQANGFRRAWGHFEAAGHCRAGTEALGNAGVALQELGQLERAEEHLRKLWAIAERMGLKHLLGGTLCSLANILAYQGRLDEARGFGERAIKWTTDNNDQYFGSAAQHYMSVIEHLSMNYPAAEGHARQAMEILANNLALQPFAVALLARSLHGQGKIAEALSCARDAYSQLEARGQVQDGEMPIRLAFVECLVASSDLEAAKQVLAKAVARLRKQASNIDNPEWRQSFLTRIPEHRRILELAHEFGLATSYISRHPSRS